MRNLVYIVSVCKGKEWSGVDALTYVFSDFEKAAEFIQLSLCNLMLVQVERKAVEE